MGQQRRLNTEESRRKVAHCLDWSWRSDQILAVILEVAITQTLDSLRKVACSHILDYNGNIKVVVDIDIKGYKDLRDQSGTFSIWRPAITEDGDEHALS